MIAEDSMKLWLHVTISAQHHRTSFRSRSISLDCSARIEFWIFPKSEICSEWRRPRSKIDSGDIVDFNCMALDYWVQRPSQHLRSKSMLHYPLLPREHISLLHINLIRFQEEMVSYPSTCCSVFCNTTENYPQWVAAIAGQMGKMDSGFFLRSRIFKSSNVNQERHQNLLIVSCRSTCTTPIALCTAAFSLELTGYSIKVLLTLPNQSSNQTASSTLAKLLEVDSELAVTGADLLSLESVQGGLKTVISIFTGE